MSQKNKSPVMIEEKVYDGRIEQTSASPSSDSILYDKLFPKLIIK